MKHIDLSSIKIDEQGSKKREWKTVVLILGWVAVLVLGGGIFWSIFSGLVALIATALLALLAVELLPWIALKTANWGSKLIKHEATLNPIDTLEKLHSENSALLDEKLTGIQDLRADWLAFKQDIDGFKTRFPDEDHSKDEELIDIFRKQIQSAIEDHQSATKELDAFADGIDKAQARWDIANKSVQLSEKAKLSISGRWNSLLKETSIKALEHKTNLALAKLDTTLLANIELKKKMSTRHE